MVGSRILTSFLNSFSLLLFSLDLRSTTFGPSSHITSITLCHSFFLPRIPYLTEALRHAAKDVPLPSKKAVIGAAVGAAVSVSLYPSILGAAAGGIIGGAVGAAADHLKGKDICGGKIVDSLTRTMEEVYKAAASASTCSH